MEEQQFLTKLIHQTETAGFGHSWLVRPGLVGVVRVDFSRSCSGLKDSAGLSLYRVVAVLLTERALCCLLV